MSGKRRKTTASVPNMSCIFKWSDPPAGGNPGSEYGCRCSAHAFDENNYETEQRDYFNAIENDTEEQEETEESSGLVAAVSAGGI